METRKEKIIKFKGNISQAVADDRISSSCARQIMDEFDAILALPIEVPSEEEIKSQFPVLSSHQMDTDSWNSRLKIVGAKWAIEQTIKRNK